MFASFLFAVAQGPGRPIRITDYRAIVGLSSPRFSPDGKQVAFVRTVQDFKKDRNVNTLDVVDIDRAVTRRLTDGSSTVSDPHWSPIGGEIAYISADKHKVDQIFATSLAGITRQITHTKNGVQQFCWSPRGNRIAFVTPDDYRGNANIDLFDIDDVGYLTNAKPMPSHLWTIAATGGTPKRLTRGTWSVLETAAPFAGGTSDPTWSADGKWIAFDRQETPYNSRSDQSTIAAVNVATGAVKILTSRPDYEYQPAFSPRVSAVAFLQPHGPTPLSVMDLAVVGMTGSAYALTGVLDRDITAFAWGGSDIVVEASDGIGRKLWRHRQKGSDVPIDLGDLVPTDFDATNHSVVFVASTATTPSELYVQDGENAPRALTHLNALFPRYQYGRVTELKWNAPDGEACDGVLTYPVGYTQGQAAPLVVWIHGGPEQSAFAGFNSFEGDFLRQTLAGEGYVFFQPNYRGSDNLGNHHEHAIYRDPGEGPMADIVAGIDKLVADGVVDAKRIAVAGHSYGGLMTTWLISHDHRWRCAVVADGAVDWRETYDLTSDGNLAWARDSLGGSPSDPNAAELYRTGSPITYADQITTPTFIITGTADQTVPATESFELYHVLKDHHVPVRFVGVPGAHHTPDSPNQYERFYILMANWIRHWNPAR